MDLRPLFFDHFCFRGRRRPDAPARAPRPGIYDLIRYSKDAEALHHCFLGEQKMIDG